MFGDCIAGFIIFKVGRISHAITKPSRGNFPRRNHHFLLGLVKRRASAETRHHQEVLSMPIVRVKYFLNMAKRYF